MKVSKIVVEGFCGISNKATVDLPSTGLVLVTGRNGYGKTTLIEAVSHGVWGEGVFRDGSLWAEKGAIEVHTHDGTSISRTRSGSRTSVSIVGRTGEGFYDTATKANIAAQQSFGSHSAWRTTHIVEPSDAAMFTRANDTVRKHVLESMLGLQVYDDALVRSRTFRKAADMTREAVATRVAAATSKLATLREIAASAKSLRPFDVVKADVAQLPGQLASARTAYAAAEEQRKENMQRRATLEAALASLTASCQHLNRVAPHSSVCPVCNTVLNIDTITKINVKADAETQDIDTRLNIVTAKIADACAQKEVIEVTHAAAWDRVRDLTAREAEATRELAVWQQTVNLNQQIAEEEALLASLENQLRDATNDRDLYHTVEAVLGVRGVRAHILNNAVTALCSYAQQWMHRLSDGEMTVDIKSYTEGTREARNAISIVMDRGGRSTPYAACSRGEQRRIDIAVTLALADVQAAANTTATGTLFVDEIMDGLDDDGALATLECLSSMAAARCVVVITHKASVQLAAKSAAHYMFVAPGVVERAK